MSGVEVHCRFLVNEYTKQRQTYFIPQRDRRTHKSIESRPQIYDVGLPSTNETGFWSEPTPSMSFGFLRFGEMNKCAVIVVNVSKIETI